MLGQVSQLSKALQSLKHQLDLPTQTVRFQNFHCRTAGAGRKHDHVLSKFERSRPGESFASYSLCAARADESVEPRNRSFVLRTTDPQTMNLEHARPLAI